MPGGIGLPAGFEGGIWAIAKIFVLFGLLLYLVFAVVVIREVKLMTRTVTGRLDSVVQVVAWVHFVLTVGIFLLALIML